ncbi:uncharacterized protein LOC126687754 [Mercurialis annua]|uniref:uncharacterized protein LOC126687754 n=1 Tax=Mercurialis annua TaxID=3986 RepID=UPI00215DE50B|nr:uncharacterized protein LOC126687754 [Mercurialis annua]
MSSGSNSHGSSARSSRQYRPRQRRGSRPVYNYEGGARYCKCAFSVKAPIWVSWTRENPGRRFYGCRKGAIGCGFFDWYDEEPFTSRSKEVINELLDEIDEIVMGHENFNYLEDREDQRSAEMRNSYEFMVKLAREEGQKYKNRFWCVAAGFVLVLMVLILVIVAVR